MFVSTAFMSPSITNSSEIERVRVPTITNWNETSNRKLFHHILLLTSGQSPTCVEREREKSCLSIYLSELIFDRRSNITVGVKKAIAPQHVYHHCCMVFQNHSKSLNLQQYNPFWWKFEWAIFLSNFAYMKYRWRRRAWLKLPLLLFKMHWPFGN